MIGAHRSDLAQIESYSITWQDEEGKRQTRDLSGVPLQFTDRELGFFCKELIPSGRIIRVQGRDGSRNGAYVVRDCRRDGRGYRITAECADDPSYESPDFQGTDLYEILQINPKADLETINRVFRMMATRFHPDNPETGDEEKFLELKRAHSVLSDPRRRAEYNSYRERRDDGPNPIFENKGFVVGIESEMNRRLGVLALLYNQRRINPDHPGVSLLDLERKIDLPREMLSFSTWYLKAKQLVSVADNCDYTVTADGAEFLEKHASENELLASLINGRGSKNQAEKAPRQPTKDSGEEIVQSTKTDVMLLMSGVIDFEELTAVA